MVPWEQEQVQVRIKNSLALLLLLFLAAVFLISTSIVLQWCILKGTAAGNIVINCGGKKKTPIYLSCALYVWLLLPLTCSINTTAVVAATSNCWHLFNSHATKTLAALT